MHEDKSRVRPSGKRAAARAHAHAAGTRIPVYKFVGFTCYLGLSVSGKCWRLKVKSRGDRKRAKLSGLRKYLKESLNTPNTPHLISQVKAAERWWAQYHAVSDNQRQVSSFIDESKRILFHWFNRLGGRKKWTRDRFGQLLKRGNYPNVPPLVTLYPTSNRAKA